MQVQIQTLIAGKAAAVVPRPNTGSNIEMAKLQTFDGVIEKSWVF